MNCGCIRTFSQRTQGEPTFKPGGNPTLDAKNFWIDARRGILRAPIDRIGLGGYLSSSSRSRLCRLYRAAHP